MKGLTLLAMLASTGGPVAAQPLIEGNPKSAVRVIIYEDLQCPDCAAFRRMLDERLLPQYGSKVGFEHRDFPLARHAWARKAAVAARFFQETDPELALSFRRHMMADIKGITKAGFEESLAAFAKSHGVDPARAAAALADSRLAALVEKDFQEGVARGVSRTPTAFVNGTPFIETFTYEEISKGIEAALAEVK
jgi:protein-disulfide isomerase